MFNYCFLFPWSSAVYFEAYQAFLARIFVSYYWECYVQFASLCRLFVVIFMLVVFVQTLLVPFSTLVFAQVLICRSLIFSPSCVVSSYVPQMNG